MLRVIVASNCADQPHLPLTRVPCPAWAARVVCEGSAHLDSCPGHDLCPAAQPPLTYLLGFVQTSARAAAEARSSRLESAMSDAQWWDANAPLLARIFDPAAFPTAARIGSAAGAAHGAAYSPEHAHGFGLQRVLDGLGVLIAAR